MRTLEEEDDDAFKRQFSQYIKNGITADSVSFTFTLNRPTKIADVLFVVHKRRSWTTAKRSLTM